LRNRFLRTIWARLQRALRISSQESRAYNLDQDLLQSVRGLADKEQRPAQDVAADLLSLALQRRQSNQELLARWQSLSGREQEVAALICLGYTSSQIGRRLNLSTETIRTHARNIMYKFGLHSRGELRLLLAYWDFSDWKEDAS
jgi:DNA-binding CsgD family transcriptional regulator